MSAVQLRELVLDQHEKVIDLEQNHRILTKRIEVTEEKNRTLLIEKDHLLQEKESLLKKIQDILEKFSSIKFELSQMKRLVFGSKRERFVSNGEDGQMSLPFEVEALPDGAEPPTEKISFTRRKANRKNHHGRLPLPDHLPVEEILIEPEEDVTGLKCIGYEITDELEYDAAMLKIKRYKRPKYGKANNEGVITGNLPTRPIKNA